jgi:hypothetical protein
MHDLLLIVAMLCLLQDSSEPARGVGRGETRQKIQDGRIFVGEMNYEADSAMNRAHDVI